MRRTFNRFLPAACIITLSLGAARFVFSDGPSDTPRFPAVPPTPAAGQTEPSSGGPLILNLGPPPVVYSPSADFSTRVEAVPGWAVASDTRTAANSPAHPVVSAPANDALVRRSHRAIRRTDSRGCRPVFRLPAADAHRHATACVAEPAFLLCAPAEPAVRVSDGIRAAGLQSGRGVSLATGHADDPAGSPRNLAYSSPAAGEADQLDHILQAVHHLEAAGLQADADRLRRECDDKVERLIASLKSSGAALPRLHPAPQLSAEANEANEHRPVVTAQIYMLDIDVNKLAALANNADANAVARFATANLAAPQQGGFETFKGDAAAPQIGD